MPKPQYVPTPLNAGVQGWDAVVTDNFNQVKEVFSDAPSPVPSHAGDETDLEATYPAADFEECVVFVEHTTHGRVLARSDGVSWQFIPVRAAAVSTTGTTVSAPPTQAEVTAIRDKLNQLISALTASGAVTP